MTTKSWDDSDIVNISTGLDNELREIFADMEAVLGKPRTAAKKDDPAGPVDDFDSPLPVDEANPWPRKPAEHNRAGAEEDFPDHGDLDEEVMLQDEFELPPASGRRPPLAGDFERSVAGISPAAHREDLDDDDLYGPAADLAPVNMTRRAGRLGGPDEAELPEAEILPDEHEEDDLEFGYAATVAQLSPEDLSRLIERAVIRGLSKALKKSGR